MTALNMQVLKSIYIASLDMVNDDFQKRKLNVNNAVPDSVNFSNLFFHKEVSIFLLYSLGILEWFKQFLLAFLSLHCCWWCCFQFCDFFITLQGLWLLQASFSVKAPWDEFTPGLIHWNMGSEDGCSLLKRLSSEFLQILFLEETSKVK